MRFFRLLFFALFLKVANSYAITNLDDTVSHFTRIITNWVSTEPCDKQEESEEFRQLIHTLVLPTSLQRDNWHSFDGERGDIMCVICQSALNTFLKLRREGMSEESIRCRGIKLCSALNLAPDKVCEGAITINLPIILHIIDSRPNLTATTMCGVLLDSRSCPLNDEKFNWTVNIDNGPPILIDPEESDETLNIAQINSSKLYITLCNINLQNISYVYFTGDIVDHGVWETTVEGNAKSLYKSYLQIHETFKNYVPVYPLLGNHEPHPLNQFAPTSITNSELSTAWLFKMMADLWIHLGWLPESTRSTILQGGYYTVTPSKGFRIIALNSNVCYCFNWWLWYEPKDPYGQLQWMADTLLQAEKDGEFVHILAHIPPGDKECLSTWRREYIKVVKRFSHIIRAQFNGHSHNDEVHLYYGVDDNNTINVGWNGGSATTYQNLNNNYKLYIVDSKNYGVKDFENWMYNLTLANANPDKLPPWYKSYSFKEEYGLSDLSYDSLQVWLSKLATDINMLSRYYRNFFKHAEPSLSKECDAKCMRPYMCRIIASLGDHRTKCENNEYLKFTPSQL
ncbi:PREDICTED: sphingomyelin phosphodiesterase-like [Vollenhovia emeryi]|uniref:sphingomyelin phosphodiesterase-like n=1 Tax=Vollenhovia emeryi TaxID=411798 RepID=UPI0005F5199C|nr:PREDICTED: sphingomyelin phosphodiesterase-like [Vollenhovia emeryi]